MTSAPDRSELPQAPDAASTVFGDRLPLVQRFCDLLGTTGVTHGLIGPREIPRLWDRHLLNSAVVASLIPADVDVIDVGSGAGLPGIALAIARPDLRVTLVEPMLRRVTWLQRTVEELGVLGLDGVTIRRGRAESFWGELAAPVVTARAVARLDELSMWCLPLLTAGGQLLALKGSAAADELTLALKVWQTAGPSAPDIRSADVVHVGDGVVAPPTTVVQVRLGDAMPIPQPPSGGRRRKVSTPVRATRAGRAGRADSSGRGTGS